MPTQQIWCEAFHSPTLLAHQQYLEAHRASYTGAASVQCTWQAPLNHVGFFSRKITLSTIKFIKNKQAGWNCFIYSLKFAFHQARQMNTNRKNHKWDQGEMLVSWTAAHDVPGMEQLTAHQVTHPPLHCLAVLSYTQLLQVPQQTQMGAAQSSLCCASSLRCLFIL